MRQHYHPLLSLLIALSLTACGQSGVILVTSTAEPPTKPVEASATPGVRDTPAPITQTATREPAATLTATATKAPQNLLANESFRWWCAEGTGAWPGCVPNYWSAASADWASDADPDCKTSVVGYEIETDPAYTDADGYAARWHTGYGSGWYGIRQRVPATPGKTYRFTATMYLWAGDGVKGHPSMGAYNIVGMAGIDPTGGADMVSADVQWGRTWQLDQYTPVTVEVVAKSDAITVYTAGKFRWCLARNDMRVSNTELIEVNTAVGGGANSVQPTPTIIEVGNARQPVGIGVAVFTRDTHLRDCLGAAWTTRLDPVYTCKKMLLEDGSPNMLRSGNFSTVHEFANDRYGNLWAWFDDVGSIAAVACFKGATHAVFFKGLSADQYDALDEENLLPDPVSACNVAATY
jgi:hypothetical protein